MENYRSMREIQDMFGVTTHVSKKPGFAPRKPKAPVKIGATCPVCYTKKSLLGVCFCNDSD